MKFYNRKQELNILEKHFKQAEKGIILDVLIGRRRIGKTELVKHFAQGKKYLYFFVGRKPIVGLLNEWSEVLRLEYPQIGDFTTIESFLRSLFELAGKEKLVIIFDEFQNFKYIDRSVFSSFQKLIDDYKKKSKALLIIIGSITTLMENIFSNSKEPLFGRATRKIYLNSLELETSSRILHDFGFKNKKRIFDLYSIFNGVPKYYSLFEEEDILGDNLESIVKELIFEINAPLRREGEDLLREEFGRDYQRYFEILFLVSIGKTKLSEIASGMKLPVTTVNIYLSKLEKHFKLIERRLPIFEKKEKRLGRYFLKDTFLLFWFRFVYRYFSLLEKGAYSVVMKIFKRDFSSYQGIVFEDTVKDLVLKLSAKNKFPFLVKEVGSFWSRKDQGDIDIVAVSEDNRELFLGECKLNINQVNKKTIDDLILKSEYFSKKFKKIHFGVFTFAKLSKKQEKFLKEKNVMSFSLEEYV